MAWAQSAGKTQLPLDLSVRGQVQQNREHTEYRALAVLEVPLEQSVQPRPSADGSRPVTPKVPAAETQASKPEVPMLVRRETRQLANRSVLRLARQTVAQALLAQNSAEGGERLESLRSRARSSAWLPELRLRAQTSQDEALRLTPTDTDPFRYTQSGQNTLLFEAGATFRLNRLLYADEELAIERARVQRAQERLELEQQIIKLIFEWQGARIKSALLVGTEEEAAQAGLKALDLEARLDALTAGWFSLHGAQLVPNSR